jgi:hypothetical protein
LSHYEEEFARKRAERVMYLGGDRSTREAIVRVLLRLPGDALDLAVDKCLFLSVGSAVSGQTQPKWVYEPREWLILLYDQAPNLETLIAHEIAHAYRGHSVSARHLSEEEMERQARELTRSWGFTEAEGSLS